MPYENNSISYIQIPPDSTGKALQALKTQFIPYTGKVGGFDFTVGQIITGGTSLATGMVVYVDVVTSTTGTIGILVSKLSTVDVFTSFEPLLFETVQKATAGTIVNQHTQTYVKSGGNNPLNLQYVDQKGGAFVRYSEGEQQINAFGVSRVSQSFESARYYFKYGTESSKFTDQITSSGSITHLPNEASVALDVTEDDLDSVIRTTNRYHLYQPGFSQLTQMSVISGDTGKDGVVRRWGTFDGYNGIFFEQNESTLNIVLRTNTSGSMVESRIAQSFWSGDKINGAGGQGNLSQFDINLSKENLYWIDYAWLGAGIARAGVYADDGARIICHIFRNANNNSTPYMAEANLPLRWEIYNTETTASPSRLKITCASVITEGPIPSDAQRSSARHAYATTVPVTVYDGYFTPIVSVRPVQYINGVLNRKVIVPESMSIYSSINPILMSVMVGAVPNDPDFIQHSISSVAFDKQSTSYLGGLTLLSVMGNAGCTYIPNNGESFSAESSSIFLNADGTYGPYLTIAIKCLKPGETTDIILSINWVEI